MEQYGAAAVPLPVSVHVAALRSTYSVEATAEAARGPMPTSATTVMLTIPPTRSARRPRQTSVLITFPSPLTAQMPPGESSTHYLRERRSQPAPDHPTDLGQRVLRRAAGRDHHIRGRSARPGRAGEDVDVHGVLQAGRPPLAD